MEGSFNKNNETYRYQVCGANLGDVRRFCQQFDYSKVDTSRKMKIRTTNDDRFYREFNFTDVIDLSMNFVINGEYHGEYMFEIAIPLKIYNLPVIECSSIKTCEDWYNAVSVACRFDKGYYTQMKVLSQVAKICKIDITEDLNTFIIDGLYPSNPPIEIAKSRLREAVINKIAEYTAEFTPIEVNNYFYKALEQLKVLP